MFSYEYIHSSYSDMIGDISAQLGVKLKDNWLFFPEDIASGYYRVLQLSNGLDVNIINCRINKDWLLRRKSDDTEYYTLRFDELTVEKNITIGIDTDVMQKQKET